MDNNFKYKGTLPLDLKLFPEVAWEDSLGRKRTSNIKTRLERLSLFTENPDDSTKWVLFPTMMKGEDLDKEKIFSMILNNKHFGIYNSFQEGEGVDLLVHKTFEDKKPIKDKIIDWLKGF